MRFFNYETLGIDKKAGLSDNGGEEPSAEQICEFRLYLEDLGCAPVDPYNILIGPITHQVGVCESSTKSYKQFRPGECYEVRIVQTGMGDCGTCRYSASIDDISLPEGVVMVINDPQGLLGTNKQYTASNKIKNN